MARRALPVHLPPGGRSRLDDLAAAISERPGFFDDSYAIDEYDPDAALTVGPLTVRFAAARHYVPAWAMSVEAPDGARLVYTGDTGPSDAMTEFARGADLLLVEASLRDAGEDDDERGHLTAAEAIDLARNADVRAARLVHYAPDRRAELEALCAAAGPWIRPAVQGLSLTGLAAGRGRARGRAGRLTPRRLQRRTRCGAVLGDVVRFGGQIGGVPPEAGCLVRCPHREGGRGGLDEERDGRRPHRRTRRGGSARVSTVTGVRPASSRSASRAWRRRRRDASIPAYAVSWTNGWLNRHLS